MRSIVLQCHPGQSEASAFGLAKRIGRLVPVLMAIAASAGAQEPRGTAGIAAARGGGVVIACRHGITDSANEDEMTLSYTDPTTQRRLSARGERQAQAMGRAFRALGIPVGEVIASPMQRAARTGDLAFGQIRLDSLWHTRGENYAARRQQRLEALGQPVSKTNRVIFSHLGTLSSVVSIRELNEGDCVVLKPLGDARHEVVSVVPWRSWLQAARIDPEIPR